jgi:hypothetical protein
VEPAAQIFSWWKFLSFSAAFKFTKDLKHNSYSMIQVFTPYSPWVFRQRVNLKDPISDINLR